MPHSILFFPPRLPFLLSKPAPPRFDPEDRDVSPLATETASSANPPTKVSVDNSFWNTAKNASAHRK